MNRHRAKFCTTLSLLTLGFGLCALPLQAQVTAVPPLLPFQGRLATPDGNPVPDGTYSIRFSLWDDAAAGTEKWNQTLDTLTVKNGTFSTLLVVDTPGLFDGDLWLEIKIGTDDPLTPRQRLASTAYALKAGTVPDGSITNAKIVSVDWSKILNAPSSNFTLPFSGTTSSGGAAFSITNNSGNAIIGSSTNAGYASIFGKNLTSGNFGYFSAGDYGVYGAAPNANGKGVYGSGVTAGVYGSSTAGWGVVGNNATTGNTGYLGLSSSGVYGDAINAQSNGVFGHANNPYSGVVGINDGSGSGVSGASVSGFGVYGRSQSAGGVGGYFKNTAGGFGLYVEGTASVGVLEIRGGADLAEKFAVEGKIEPGMVVEIDPDHEGKLRLASGAFNRRVAGVISGAKNLSAGVVLTDPADKSKDSLPVAMSGRVWVYTDATERAVEPGDFMTTAERAGHAMPITDIAKAQGAILGKAMTKLPKGKVGLVLVLVNLQ